VEGQAELAQVAETGRAVGHLARPREDREHDGGEDGDDGDDDQQLNQRECRRLA
jgi:hypothetical protein